MRERTNLNVHVHVVAVDAVFEKDGAGVRVHDAPPPAKEDVETVARRVHDRVVRWLRRHRYRGERPAEDRGNEPAEPAPADALTTIALSGGTFAARPFTPKPDYAAALEHKERRFSAKHGGFDVHCAVRLAQDDDEGRERLVRYCARPAFAAERFELLPDGRIAYLMSAS